MAFDGDGDRVGLITNKGENVFPDKYMMMLSENILSKSNGSIVFDVKCSNHLEHNYRKPWGTYYGSNWSLSYQEDNKRK